MINKLLNKWNTLNEKDKDAWILFILLILTYGFLMPAAVIVALEILT